MNPQSNSTTITLGNIKFFLLIRVIEEIVQFIDIITEEKTQFVEKICKGCPEMQTLVDVKKEMKAHKKEEKIDQTKTVIKLKDIEVYIPQNSNSNGHIRIIIEEGEVQLVNGSCKFTVPRSVHITKIIKEKFIAVLGDERMISLDSLQIVGTLQRVKMFVHHEELENKNEENDIEHQMAEVMELKVCVSIPEERELDGWKVDTDINVKVKEVNMRTTIGNMLKLTTIFESNADEDSPFLDHTATWLKHLTMNIGVDSGSYNMGVFRIDDSDAVVSKQNF